MEAFLEEAGVGREFVTALRSSGAGIAGSAALYVVRSLFGVANTWKPNDIDVWLPWVPGSAADAWAATATLRGVLEGQGFTYGTSNGPPTQTYAYMVHNIVCVFTFYNPTERFANIQIILVKGIALREVAHRFDLSVCKVVWTPECGFGLTALEVIRDACISQAELSRGEVYDLPTRSHVERKVARTKARIAKYERRGFKIVGEREALVPVQVRWRLIEWSRQDHAFFPAAFKERVRELVKCVWVLKPASMCVLDNVIRTMWKLE